MGLDDFDWIGTYAKRLNQGASEADAVEAKIWATIAAVNTAIIDNKNYAGLYKDPWFGNIEIYEEDQQLWFRSLRSPKLSGAHAILQSQYFCRKMARVWVNRCRRFCHVSVG